VGIARGRRRPGRLYDNRVPRDVAVTFLFNETCPSHEEALDLLKEAAHRADVRLNLEVREVVDDAEAAALRFPGSPTYLIEGRDLAELPEGVPFRAEACRAYRLPGGRVGPLPHLDALVSALRTRRSEETG
jgi:hypothetical protein